MRLSSLSFLAALVASTLATTTLDVAQILEELPSCAISCISTDFANSTCALTDLTCLCENEPLQAKLTTCVSKACDAHDQATLDVIENKLCAAYPHPSREKQLVLAGYITISIITPIVLLRLFCRVRISKQVGLDDVAIFIAAAMLIALIVLDLLNAKSGFGLHLWNVDPTKIVFLLKNFYIAEMIYIAVLAFTKISILLFYLRIFITEPFRIMTWLTIGFILLYAITFILLIGLQCQPVEAVWNRSIEGKCLDLSIVAYSSAGISILQDLIILSLPIREIVALNIGTKQKINVLIMFSVGVFATATSCIRFNFLVQFATSTDETWTNIPATLWSLIEINVGVFCACLPSIRALLIHYFPSVFSSTLQKSTDSYQLSSLHKPKFVELSGVSPLPNKNNNIAIWTSTINKSKSQTEKVGQRKDLDFLNMSEEELQKIYEAQRGERDSFDLRNGAAFQTERLPPPSPVKKSNSQTRRPGQYIDLEFLNMSEEDLQRIYEAQRGERDNGNLRNGAAFRTEILPPSTPELRSLPQSSLYMSEEALEANYRSAMQGREGRVHRDRWAMNHMPPLQYGGFSQNSGGSSNSRRLR